MRKPTKLLLLHATPAFVTIVLLLSRCMSHGLAFSSSAVPLTTEKSTTTTPLGLPLDPAFVPPDCTGALITEELCIDTAQRMQRINIPVDTTIHPDGQVGVSYVHWPAAASTTTTTTTTPPNIVLIHGFDSSALEFRRLGSQLAARGINTYAVDLWGWGFTRFQPLSSDGGRASMDFSASAKVAVLQSWISTVLSDTTSCTDYYICGASLGGAAAIEVAVLQNSNANNNDDQPRCQGLVLMDAQGFVDGVGMMSLMPKFIAKWGVDILQSIPLRSSANQMSYANPTVYATDEAVTIGRLHCLRPGWNDAMINFMKSGGFAPSQRVPQIAVPTLVIWGRQDTILDGTKLAPQFVQSITKAPTTLRWIENCGHVPHLEQPQETANTISEFIRESRVNGEDTARMEIPFFASI